MKIAIINGPNLNMLGIREKNLYGESTYKDLIGLCKREGKNRNIKTIFFQSNSEGKLIDFIQKCYKKIDGIIINAGGYTHTSVAILDALKTVSIPTAEVHITDIKQREPYRQKSYISEYALITICGHGFKGYIEAIDYLLSLNGTKNDN